ncbi:MAG TPA: alpha/beta hydrolase [Vicinamibacterales bacterium]|nr:alpha/beta hydrolase [Vicinamibacterales bacterium]
MSPYAWLVIVPLVIAAAYLALLFMVQRSLLFPMPQEVPAGPPPGTEDVRVTYDGGEAYGIYLAPIDATGAAPLLMFMHGNGELADYWTEEFDTARRWGVGVLLVEYPGYGRATGSPSEQSITESVIALYDWAAKEPRVDAKQIVAYGRSLGAGAAVRLAINRPVAAMILESAFTSVADFAARFGAPGAIIRDRFDNRTSLSRYRGPLLILHGRHDTIVPFAHGRELATIVPGTRFVELNCGHNDCPREWDAIRRLLDAAAREVAEQ